MQLLLGDPLGSGPFLAEPSSDQVSGDARVRYLACESLFNVAKVANEVLVDGWLVVWNIINGHL